ncbi:MAG: hypothetical protein JXR95_07930, partial [Deltaproteobacteria bacterium]|nr:hypothetical protein [Deltaproteobacteria bacterium]
ICSSSETCSSCPSDCGSCITCGDGICSSSETCSSCPSDCGSCVTCGDGICSSSETCSSCPSDCGSCYTPECNTFDSCSSGSFCNLESCVSLTKYYRFHKNYSSTNTDWEHRFSTDYAGTDLGSGFLNDGHTLTVIPPSFATSAVTYISSGTGNFPVAALWEFRNSSTTDSKLIIENSSEYNSKMSDPSWSRTRKIGYVATSSSVSSSLNFKTVIVSHITSKTTDTYSQTAEGTDIAGTTYEPAFYAPDVN